MRRYIIKEDHSEYLKCIFELPKKLVLQNEKVGQLFKKMNNPFISNAECIENMSRMLNEIEGVKPKQDLELE